MSSCSSGVKKTNADKTAIAGYLRVLGMIADAGFERCLAFINCQMQGRTPSRSAEEATSWRAVTISRQTGCGASIVVAKLCEILQAVTPDGTRPWTGFDRTLIEQVLADHPLPARLASFMPEDRVPGITDTIEEAFGLHPPTWLMARHTAETILHLAELGNVILVGRGASVITAKLAHVLHL